LSDIDEIKKQRFLFLHQLWKLTAGDHSKRVLVRQVSESLNLKEDDARIIIQYLVGEDLLEITSHGFNVPSYSDASLYIKHKGVVEVEQALSKPESATPHFPASVVNNINIGTMSNSNISQASSSVNQTVTLSQETKKELTILINTLKKFLENEELRQWRINSWKNRIAPEGYAFPGDPRNWEQVRYDTAKLSELGKKLLGLNRW